MQSKYRNERFQRAVNERAMQHVLWEAELEIALLSVLFVRCAEYSVHSRLLIGIEKAESHLAG